MPNASAEFSLTSECAYRLLTKRSVGGSFKESSLCRVCGDLDKQSALMKGIIIGCIRISNS